jgi:hypothetical protein
MADITIYGLSGWKRSGKDTVANFLVENHGFKRLAFADPLKEGVARDFKIERASIDDPALKEAPLLQMPVAPKDAYSRMIAEFMIQEFRTKGGGQPTSFNYWDGKFYGIVNNRSEPLYWTRRALCILEGSTKRSTDPDYWVKQAVAKAEPRGLYVVSDLRYKNEAESLRRFGGDGVKLIRVNRFDSSPSSDPSERDLDDYDFDVVIENRGTISDLYAQASVLL